MSEIRATTISNAAGTGPVTLTGQSAAKAFSLVDQTGPTILKSGNVSSFTDVAAGNARINFTSAMSATRDYCANVTQNRQYGEIIVTLDATYLQYATYGFIGLQDSENGSTSVFGDLA